jgi:transcriptional regulator with XRE-family HTH domain
MKPVLKPNLRALRIQTGLTRYQLAQILDISFKTVAAWERGLQQPRMSASKFSLLCQTLNCSIQGLALAIEQTFHDEQGE